MKKSEIRKLIIEEINNIGEEDFHHLCVEFLSEKFNQKFINTGINRRNRPVGHDLDAISPDGKISGEFSVEQDYFSKRLNKLRSDLGHSLKRNPKPDDIVLISSQPVGNVQRKIISVYSSFIKFKTNTNIEIYDSNRLVDELMIMATKSQSFFNSCSNHLTLFKRLMVLHGAENLFPPLGIDYKAREIQEQVIKKMVDKNKILLIHGISGVGKSQIVINTKNSIMKNFDSVFWVSGDDLKDITSLRSYELKMYGNTYDLLGLMSESNVLLYIDSLENKDLILEQLTQIKISNNSKIIVTSQKKTTIQGIKNYLLEGMTEEEFRGVFENESTISDHEIARIHKFTNGHPLVASVISKLLIAGDILPKDLNRTLDEIGNIDVGQNQTLVDRLLSNHMGTIVKGLSFIRAINNERIHKKLTEVILGSMETSKLKNRGFLVDQESEYYKIHDLLFNAIKNSSMKLDEEPWKKKVIELFKDKNAYLSELEFYQISNNHFSLLRSIAWEKLDTIALYLVASYTEVDEKFEAEEYQGKFISKINSIDFKSTNYYEVMMGVEFYEVMYRHYEYYKKDKAESKKMIDFGLALCLKYLSDADDRSFEKNVFHHAGKFSRLAKDIPKAMNYYDSAIALDNNFLEPKLQKFRIFHWVDTDRESTAELKAEFGGKADIELVKVILEEGYSNFANISPSLLLYTFDELKKSPFYSTIEEFLERYEDTFYKTLKIAQFSDRHSYLKVVGAVGDKFIRRNPDRFLETFNNLSIPGPQSSDEKVAFNLGQTYKSLAKVKKDKSLLKLAEMYYDVKLKCEYVNDFDLSHIVDLLNLRGDTTKATLVYNRIKRKEDAFCCLRRAWTLSKIGNKDEALEMVNKGINGLQPHFHGLHMETFLELKRRIEQDVPLSDSSTW